MLCSTDWPWPAEGAEPAVKLLRTNSEHKSAMHLLQLLHKLCETINTHTADTHYTHTNTHTTDTYVTLHTQTDHPEVTQSVSYSCVLLQLKVSPLMPVSHLQLHKLLRRQTDRETDGRTDSETDRQSSSR